MSRRFFFIVAGLALLACEPRRRDALRVVGPKAEVAAAPAPDGLFARAEGRLHRQLPERPRQEHQRCPDETLAHGQREQSSVLVRLRDDRLDRKNIMPLELLQTLGADPLARFRDSPRRTKAEDEALESLSERRYLAELVVRVFSPPTHFRRLNALHSEWSGGRFDAELVVYDLENDSVLCSAKVQARGDATGAPLSRRLRESTRADLERKLYARALREVNGALSSITRVLRWPEEALALSRNEEPSN